MILALAAEAAGKTGLSWSQWAFLVVQTLAAVAAGVGAIAACMAARAAKRSATTSRQALRPQTRGAMAARDAATAARDAADTGRKSLDVERAACGAEWLLKLADRFRFGLFAQTRLELASAFIDRKFTTVTPQTQYIIGFFEELGLLADTEVADREFVWEVLRIEISGYWRLLRGFRESQRHAGLPTWEHFEELAKYCKERDKTEKYPLEPDDGKANREFLLNEVRLASWALNQEVPAAVAEELRELVVSRRNRPTPTAGDHSG